MTGEFCLRGFLKRAALLILAVVVFVPIAFADEDQPDTPEQKFNFVNETDLRFAEIEIESGLPESADPVVLGQQKGKQEGKPAKFFSFTYGDEASRAVCMKYLPSQPSVLHVDVNRDQKFSDQEAFDSDETGLWFIDINCRTRSEAKSNIPTAYSNSPRCFQFEMAFGNGWHSSGQSDFQRETLRRRDRGQKRKWAVVGSAGPIVC